MCLACLVTSPVVTYKKSKATNKNVPAANGGTGDDGLDKDEEELTSAQFGITDPEDEGKEGR